ncbi:MAG: hypothetical protein Q9225_000542 [Loekoesia sp. 1 TL-2023]
MQLFGEEEPNSDDPYAIPNVMLHNRQLSRVTGSPQGGATDCSSDVSPNTNVSRSSRAVHGQASKEKKQVPRSRSDPLIATQKLPSLQKERPTNEMQLSRAWATRLEKGRGFKGLLGGGSKERELIHCQCNFSEEEGEMVSRVLLKSTNQRLLLSDQLNQVQCGFCYTWQHTHCYGYGPEEVPETHACYSCLFQDVDTPRLAELKDLALTRRCLWLLYGHAPPKSQAELAKALGTWK